VCDVNLTDFTEPSDDDPSFRVLKMTTFFALETLVRAREEKLYVSFMKTLKGLFAQHVPVRIALQRDEHSLARVWL
jgi:hypothetical protein